VSTDETHTRCLTTSPDDGVSYHARWMGKPIFAALTNAIEATVRGTTSRGVFLELNTGWIAFLSTEQFRGPLTINLEKPIDKLNQMVPGQIGRVSNGLISFNSPNLRIDTQETEVWSSLELIFREFISNIMAIRNIEILNFANRLSGTLQAPNEYLEFALSWTTSQSYRPDTPTTNDIFALIKAIRLTDPSQLQDPLKVIAGRGRGLTPSGDDFLSGLLLGLHLSRQYQKHVDLAVRKVILEAIHSRSTLISANLAECAAEGEVDERIANAVSFLLYGTGFQDAALQGILDWGSSSGVDTIAGFITALKLCNQSS
jgi:Protein of unknown function (DUF2877)